MWLDPTCHGETVRVTHDPKEEKNELAEPCKLEPKSPNAPILDNSSDLCLHYGVIFVQPLYKIIASIFLQPLYEVITSTLNLILQ